jgi:hypothetical protein
MSPNGRFERLEAGSPAGLLTLHPSPDGLTLHGNVVTPTGIRHIARAWGPSHRLVVAGSPGCVALARRGLDMLIQPGGSTVFRGIAVDADLEIGEGSVRVERVGLTGWRLSAPEFGVVGSADLDPRGVPDEGLRWPLEEADPG